ncbi:MAG: hypothetical protein ACPGVU_14500 [Limisphaerales bacterium]
MHAFQAQVFPFYFGGGDHAGKVNGKTQKTTPAAANKIPSSL